MHCWISKAIYKWHPNETMCHLEFWFHLMANKPTIHINQYWQPLKQSNDELEPTHTYTKNAHTIFTAHVFHFILFFIRVLHFTIDYKTILLSRRQMACTTFMNNRITDTGQIRYFIPQRSFCAFWSNRVTDSDFRPIVIILQTSKTFLRPIKCQSNIFTGLHVNRFFNGSLWSANNWFNI